MSRSSFTSRRDFLRASILTGAVFGADSALSADATRKSSENTGKARNVIFMVSDGMNMGALTLARRFSTEVNGRETPWMTLYRERPVVRALMETASASSMVTDSAAAASAWGSGKRVKNGVLNVDPDTGKLLTPMHTVLQAAGRRTGLVTTATITHATPAGFAANVNDRGKEEEIAKQYLERKVDVLLGGGQKFFNAELRGKYAAAGYDFVETRDALKTLPNNVLKPILGLFSSSYIPFSIDRNNVPELTAKIPTLSEMAKVALDRLQHASNGFFLMIEGARIDHAGHANDAAASIHDQLAFEDALTMVLDFVDKNPDTLLILTTDHGCGGIQMNGVSADAKQGIAPGLYNATNEYFLRLKNFQRSTEWMKQAKVDALSGPKLAEALKQYTGLTLTEDQIKAAQGFKGMPDVVKAHTGVGWTSGNHTGDLVEFCAYGPGSNLFTPFLLNREVHDLVLKAMAV
jgi:alkaline phosphatase